LGLAIVAISWAIAIAYLAWLYIVIASWVNRMKWERPK
jgi:predicted tellurium resistance membrane protein TerC